MNLYRAFLALLVVLLAGCTVLPTSVPPALPTRTSSPTTTPPATEILVTPSVTPGGPLTLRIWVPPEFDPSQGTPAARLLRDRLEEFIRSRPRLQLDVRVKAVEGAGGILDALTAAGAAAPQALPDLVALPRPLLETAALKGMLYPYQPVGTVAINPGLYPYARELAHLGDGIYGLPFAGDALALVYRPELLPNPPAGWEDLPAGAGELLFPAADPQALFTLTRYQSRGGAVRDETGKPVIESLVLTEVLTDYLRAEAAGVITNTLTQFQSDSQVWTAFQEGQAVMAVAWTSRYLAPSSEAASEGIQLAPLPVDGDQPFTLAGGWVWALSSRDPERQRVAAELAGFLTESEFLAAWTESAGYLPPDPDVLAGWKNSAVRPVLDRIARSAHVLPPADILIALSGPLWHATVEVLKGQNDPAAAAREASTSLAGP